MNWEKGRDTIEDLLRRGHLDRVPANEVEAQHLMTKTRAHLQTAAAVADTDPEIAYDALYAATRKALTALPVQQGLSPDWMPGRHDRRLTIRAALVRSATAS